MKIKSVTLIALVVLSILAASCYSSRKSGCPMNPQSNYRFRG